MLRQSVGRPFILNNQQQFDIVIEPGRTERNYWRDLWRYRELFYFLAWRDILVRYKQTVMGVAWSVLRPLLTMVVFTIVFGKLAKLPAGKVPYPILVFSALLPWQFFSNAFSEASNSLVNSAHMISKVYFPRIIIPTSSVIVSLVDLLISALILGFLMLFYGYAPSSRIFALPLFLLFAVATAMGAGIWIAAVNVKYRDFRHVVPFIVQFGLYISPVGFSSTVVPDRWRLLYSLNPLVGVIDGFRWSLSGDVTTLYLPGLVLSALTAGTLLLLGIVYFRKAEKTFADVI